MFRGKGKPEGGSPEGGRVGLFIYMPEIETIYSHKRFMCVPFPLFFLAFVGGGGRLWVVVVAVVGACVV